MKLSTDKNPQERNLSVALLEQSLNEIRAVAPEFSKTFYSKLFSLCPHIQPMFAHVNIKDQEKLLIQSLVLTIYNIRRPGALDYMLKELGIRHLKYGARTKHFKVFTQVLWQTMAQYLEEEWTPELQDSWVMAHELIESKMIGIGKETAPEPELASTLNLDIPVLKEESENTVREIIREDPEVVNNESINIPLETLREEPEVVNHESTDIAPEVFAENDLMENITSPKRKATDYKILISSLSRDIDPVTGSVLVCGWLSLIVFLLLMLR